MKTFAETERLILREILPTDVDDFFEMDSDPDVHIYVGNEPLQTKEQAAAAIQFIRQQYIDNGIGRWAVIDKKTNAFLGWAGLKLITEPINNHNNFLDLGYRFIKKYWRKGFASEAAAASLKYAFNELRANVVYAHAHSENLASNKILTRTGLILTGSFVHHDILCNWYKIDKETFERK
jgi:[ribosomal protein S5]-alanine N-acetyltransferase